ncbi:hypothetical protein [Litoribacillus peritrichatus]|uniref:Uncharacterized protein n=1 Tax=Litoribacillus peritrichatus TaxID=718191 RepID=A0ABP7MNT3_9GAMM
MFSQITRLSLALSLCSAFLTGCSSNSSSSDSDEVLTGQFTDSPVSGLTYTTPTQSGVTDANGSFKYLEGETVTFSIGATTLGSSPAQATVTPFDLREITRDIQDGINILTRSSADQTHHAFLNIATLLQTLDQDGDPENGIEITSEVSALLSDIRINFDQSYFRFKRDPSFRTLINSANDQATFSEHRPVRPPWLVMDHLYTQQKIQLPLMETSYSEDTNGDGVNEFRTTWFLNDQSYLARIEKDTDSDGIADNIENMTYDNLGMLIQLSEENNEENSPNIVSHWSYDANLKPTQQIKQFSTGVEHIQTSIFDAYGNQTYYGEDKDGDGVPEFTEHWLYNENGEQILYEEDYNGDGTPESITETIFDVNSTSTRTAYDFDLDGLPEVEALVIEKFNEKSQPISTSYTSNVVFFNYSFFYFYDEQGNQIRQESDNDNNGTIDVVYFSYYDNENNKILTESDYGADGSIDARTLYSYNEMGQETRIEVDNDNDGIFDSITSYEFENGNRIRNEEDTDGDGIIDESKTYTYDDYGNKTRYEWDKDGDGSADYIQASTYSGSLSWRPFFEAVTDNINYPAVRIRLELPEPILQENPTTRIILQKPNL